MPKIITTTQVQKQIGQVAKSIGDSAYIATSHGQGKIVMLPYFDGCDQAIEDYMEDYEMYKNQEVLKNCYQSSVESGESDLVI